MDWQQTSLNPPISSVFVNLIRLPPEQRDGSAVVKNCELAERPLAILDGQLAAGGRGSLLFGTKSLGRQLYDESARTVGALLIGHPIGRECRDIHLELLAERLPGRGN